MRTFVAILLATLSWQGFASGKSCPARLGNDPQNIAGNLSKFFDCCGWDDGECGCKDGMVQCCDGEVSFYCSCDDKTPDGT